MRTSKIYVSFIFYNKFYFCISTTIHVERRIKKNHLCIMLTQTKWIVEVMNCGFSPTGNQIKLLYSYGKNR